MNHLTASGLLRSQFSGIRQMMNGMAELLLFAICPKQRPAGREKRKGKGENADEDYLERWFCERI
ncbi:MAG TPA: hypothetical protein H9763_05915 [Candidatus Eisenbergiella merdigallinarum]|uniref:Uncharacterized protein n=1 Tax=Candidatus Eisenbergiella merdigallinarum TaxID=2838552 RepID=A0A9D2MS72_9FIRM|nr:hypothetical protein [Candidatus Eisenbergiella merdigallinarum]